MPEEQDQEHTETVRHLIKQDARERTQRRTAKHLTTRKWIGDFPNNVWAVDLIDFHKDKTINRHFSYILVAVDVYSRYAFTVPMKSKNTAAIKDALEETFKQANEVITHPASEAKPNRIASDEEMGLKALDRWLESKNIIHYIAEGKYGAAIAESFIKTFKEDLSYYVTKEKNNYWMNHYKKIVDEYNDRPHTALSKKINDRIVKQSPFEIYTSERKYDESDEPKKLKPKDKREVFYEGDIVRFKYNKSLMPLQKKSLMPNWSKDLFKVNDTSNQPLPYGYRLTRLTRRSQPRDFLQHKQEINNANKRLFYYHELKKSDMTPEQVNQIVDTPKITF